MDPRTETPGRFGAGRYPAVLLTAAVVLVWAYAAWFLLCRKAGLLDDAYITLHVANNVLEQGTARFFPLAEARALLATSPLRLLILLPAGALARVLAEPRSVEAARLTFLFAGLLTGGAFLPFYRRRIALWGAGLLLAGVLSVCTETALQMEGLLLSWILYTLASPRGKSLLEGNPAPIGCLLGLLVLTRPEYGLPGLVAGAAWALRRRRRRRDLAAFAGPAILLGLVWIALALALGVYPIPTTYLSKVVTGEAGLFGPAFGDVLEANLRAYFARGVAAPGFLLWVFLGMTGLVLGLGPGRHRVILLGLLLVGLSILGAGGNYIWYLENLLAGLLALVAGRLLLFRTEAARIIPPKAASSWLALFLALFLAASWGQADRAAAWSLRDGATRGTGYRNIGRACVGGGLFAFPGTDPSYLLMMEIGMVSYYGGGQVWLYDRGGLAQPGGLQGAREHFLARFYPASVLEEPGRQLTRLNERLGRARDWPPLWKAWGQPDAEAGSRDCSIYLPDQAICLQPVQTR